MKQFLTRRELVLSGVKHHLFPQNFVEIRRKGFRFHLKRGNTFSKRFRFHLKRFTRRLNHFLMSAEQLSLRGKLAITHLKVADKHLKVATGQVVKIW